MATKKPDAPERDYRQELTNRLIEQLEAGTAPWQKPWVDGPPQRPHNPTTGKPYRGGNSLALDMQGRADPRWMTYKQAAEQGWQVKKGEKGTLVEYWKFHEESKQVGADGQEKTVRAELDRPRVFRSVVFNAEQIDGIPPMEKPQEQKWDANERAEAILAGSGAVIHHDQTTRAFYRPSTDEIHLPDRGQFETQGHYYSTALHELGHWTGHESRLNRQLDGGFGSESYAREELRAELSSYFVAAELGIPHDPSQHAAYVGSWIKALREDKNEIFKAARDAEKISDFVLGMEPEMHQEASQEQAATGLKGDIERLAAKPQNPMASALYELGKKAGREAKAERREEMEM